VTKASFGTGYVPWIGITFTIKSRTVLYECGGISESIKYIVALSDSLKILPTVMFRVMIRVSGLLYNVIYFMREVQLPKFCGATMT